MKLPCRGAIYKSYQLGEFRIRFSGGESILKREYDFFVISIVQRVGLILIVRVVPLEIVVYIVV